MVRCTGRKKECCFGEPNLSVELDDNNNGSNVKSVPGPWKRRDVRKNVDSCEGRIGALLTLGEGKLIYKCV